MFVRNSYISVLLDVYELRLIVAAVSCVSTESKFGFDEVVYLTSERYNDQ